MASLDNAYMADIHSKQSLALLKLCMFIYNAFYTTDLKLLVMDVPNLVGTKIKTTVTITAVTNPQTLITTVTAMMSVVSKDVKIINFYNNDESYEFNYNGNLFADDLFRSVADIKALYDTMSVSLQFPNDTFGLTPVTGTMNELQTEEGDYLTDENNVYIDVE